MPPTPAGSTVFREAAGLHLLTWPALAASGLDAAVTARVGGVSSGPYSSLNLSLSVGDDPANVLENRHRLAAGFGARLTDFVFADQVHGAGVQIVSEADAGRGASSRQDAIPATDALVTRTPGIVLAILTADCVPIVLHDPVAGVLACVHAGWRGTVARICAAAITAMQDLGSRPADVIAGLGPAIAPARYQVGPDVHQAVTAAFGPAPFLRPDSVPDHWRLDLWAANRLVLTQAGVPAPQIHTTNIPTGPPEPPATTSIPTGPPEPPATTSIPTGPPAPPDPASAPSLTAPPGLTSPAGPGHFFSDRVARPCGRLALIARLRPGGAR